MIFCFFKYSKLVFYILRDKEIFNAHYFKIEEYLQSVCVSRGVQGVGRSNPHMTYNRCGLDVDLTLRVLLVARGFFASFQVLICILVYLHKFKDFSHI